jgi:translocation and assembly module TamA
VRRLYFLLTAASLLLVFWAAPARAQEPTDDQGTIPYKMEIKGAPGGVKGLMEKSSQLRLMKSRPPATLPALQRRASGDVGRFRQVLESEGYYDGTVESEIETTDKDAVVHILVTPGVQYKVGDFRVDLGDADSPALAKVVSSRRWKNAHHDILGKPARAEDVIAAEDSALAALRNRGFPRAARGGRQVRIDRDAHTIGVVLPVAVGPEMVFGATHFSGLKDIKQKYADDSVPWKPGEQFNLSRLDDFRSDMVDTGLFSVVKIAPDGRPLTSTADGQPLDVNVDVTEGAFRTISLGASYGRDKGLGGTASWTHRNFFHGGEKLGLSFAGDKLEQVAGVSLAKPHFWRSDQTLTLTLQGKHADTDAYREYSGSVGAVLERKLTRDWIVSGGVGLEIADISQSGVAHRSYLTSLPFTVVHADPRKVLDQNRGWRLNAQITPYFGSFDTTVAFLKNEVEVDGYLPLDHQARTVLAGKLKLGTIVGAANADIPANKRFYAGGGGSVRGFGYQRVGPLDAAGNPTGGRSLMEVGAEARFKITNTIGIVPFVDAGAVSASSLPVKGARIAVGAGIGARYYTSLGPLRVDVAVPVNPRPSDKGFQFYISFGQAF